MSASRVEYAQDLLRDCEEILKGYEGNSKATIIAALILADSLNGLRKSFLTINGKAQTNAQG